MRRIVALFLLSANACLFNPDIEKFGYRACTDISACDPGWHCELEICVPPAWWDENYAGRYQVKVHNTSAVALPAHSLVEILVGEQGLLSIGDTGFSPSVVAYDFHNNAQDRALALRDARGDHYAFVIRLSEELEPDGVDGSHWIYVAGSELVNASYSQPAEVYSSYDGFDGIELNPEKYRFEGNYSVTAGQLLLRPGAWIVSRDKWSDVVITFEMQMAGSQCAQFGVGLSAGSAPQDLRPPMAFYQSDADAMIHQQVWTSTTVVEKDIGTTFFADGLPHRMQLALSSTHVTFMLDSQVTAEDDLDEAIDSEMHLHMYSRECDMRVLAWSAAPFSYPPPTVTLGERIVWQP